MVPGTALELTVVGGSQRPLSPQANTIWVKTANAVDRVCIGPVWGLEDRRVGDIWVDISNQCKGEESGGLAAFPRLLTLSQMPYLAISVLQINRWDGAAWNNCGGSIYANGRWSDMALYLFRYGTHNSVYPLAFGNASAASTVMELNSQPEYSSNCMVVEGKLANGYGVVSIPEMTGIEVENFLAVGLGYRVVSGSVNNDRFYCGLSDAVYSGLSYSNADNMQSLQLAVSDELQEVSMPISCSGVLRPTIKFQSGSSGPLALEVHYWVLN
jgi:hypothetical protein